MNNVVAHYSYKFLLPFDSHLTSTVILQEIIEDTYLSNDNISDWWYGTVGMRQE